MASSDHSTVSGVSHRTRGCGRWSGINIAAMVIGFVLFWPLGLVILGWIMSGRSVRELYELVREKASDIMPFRGLTDRAGEFSDNVVFNEYQQTQYDRINEIKEEIKGRASRFGEYRENARRRADKEEFDRFMADTPVNGA